MISSAFYAVCFLIMMFSERRLTVISLFCLFYLLLENIMLYWFSTNVQLFDITFYFVICWALDIVLLFVCTCLSNGIRQKAYLAIAVPLLLCQIIVIQYPDKFPDYLYYFSINEAHKYFVESFIFLHIWGDNTVKEWIKTSTVLFLVLFVHFL